jgi:hypothetical protein
LYHDWAHPISLYEYGGGGRGCCVDSFRSLKENKPNIYTKYWDTTRLLHTNFLSSNNKPYGIIVNAPPMHEAFKYKSHLSFLKVRYLPFKKKQ